MLCSVFVYLLLTASPLCAKRFGGGSSGRTVHYPPSTGLSGTNTRYTTHNTGHTYPQSTGYSGSNIGHGSNYNARPQPQVHHHYHYNPPPRINYGATQHPVYHGSPPVYVYEYRNSGSRYDSLLTGLALYNLGRMSARDHHYDPNSGYRRTSNPGEVCKMRIERNRLEYEETRIDCMLISSFILESPKETNNVVVHTVTSTVNVTQTAATGNGSNSNTVTTTVQNTTVADALSVKGPSMQVTSEMQCFVIRISGYSTNLKRKVDCGLLQEYARRSMYSGSSRLNPSYLALYFGLFFVINMCRPSALKIA